MATYYVAYRTGGNIMCEWRLCALPNKDAALITQFAVAKMGYLTKLMTAEELEEHGIPIGWEPELVDRDRDFIRIEPKRTIWRKSL